MSNELNDFKNNSLIDIPDLPFLYKVTERFRENYINNKYENFSADWVDCRIKSETNFVDIGAHYGFFSMLAARKIKTGKIISVEPVRENYDLLLLNRQINSFSQIEAHQCAISDYEGTIDFHISAASDACGIHKHPSAPTLETRQVQVTTLDRLLGNLKIDILKIDTEGNELAVFDGAKTVFRNNPQLRMLVEFNPKCMLAVGRQPEELLNRIFELNFDIFLLHDKRRIPYKIPSENPEVWKNIIEPREYINFWAAPKEQSRIVIFINHNNAKQGAERSLFSTIRSCLNEGNIYPYLLTPANSQLPEDFATLPIAINQQAESFPWISGDGLNLEQAQKESEDLAIKLLPELSLVNPQLVISNTSVIIFGAYLAALLNKAHLWFVRNYPGFGKPYLLSKSEHRQFIEDLSSKVIFNSQYTANQLALDSAIRQDVIYPLVEDFSVSTDICRAAEAQKLLMLGSIHPDKGQLDAVRAIAKLTGDYPNLTLDIYGDWVEPEYLDEIQSAIQSNNLSEKVHIHKATNNPQECLLNHDALIFCSRNEPFGRVIIEAMKLKLPVIAIADGGAQEIIEDQFNGLTYQPGNTEQLAAQIVTLIKSTDLRVKLTDRASETIKNKFAFDCIAGKLVAEIKANLPVARVAESYSRKLLLRLAKEKNSIPANPETPVQTSVDSEQQVNCNAQELESQKALVQQLSVQLNRKAVKAAIALADSRLVRNRFVQKLKQSILG